MSIQCLVDSTSENRIRALIRAGAVETAKEALLSTPERSARWFWLRGLLAREEGLIQEALKEFREGLAHSFGDVDLLRELGVTLSLCEEWDLSVKYLLRAVRLNEQPRTAALQVAQELRDRGLYRQSIGLLQAVSEEIEAPELVFLHGKLLFEVGEYEGAEVKLESALESPLGREAAQFLSFIYESRYRGERLVEKLKALALRVHDPTDIFFNLGCIHRDWGQWIDSLRCFMLAFAIDPSDPMLGSELEGALSTVASLPSGEVSARELHLSVGYGLLRNEYTGVSRQELLERLEIPDRYLSRFVDLGSGSGKERQENRQKF